MGDMPLSSALATGVLAPNSTAAVRTAKMAALSRICVVVKPLVLFLASAPASSKIGRKVGEDRAGTGPLEIPRRVDIGPPVGVRRVLDLHPKCAVLANDGEFV